MAITKLNSLAIPDNTIVEADLSYPLTGFSSTGIDDNATSTAITIDASENVSMTGGVLATSFAVNNNSGNAPLQIHTVDSNSAYMQFTNATTGDTASNGLVVGFDGNEDAYVWQYETKALYFGTANTKRMHITSTGGVGIGTTSPISLGAGTQGITIEGSAGGFTNYQYNAANTGYVVAASDALSINTFTGKNLVLGTEAVERMRIDASGNVGYKGKLFSSNDLTALGGLQLYRDHATGSCYLFDTTSAPYSGPLIFGTNNTERMRILSSGGITFNGDTAAANALDDYEEGTWTPSFQHGGTLTVNSAVYTKIGRQVVASCYISNFANIPNDLNGFKITGLPFNNGIASNYGGGSLSYAATSVVDNWSDPLVIQLGNYIYFHYLDGSTGNDVRNANVFNSVSVLILQVIYFTA